MTSIHTLLVLALLFTVQLSWAATFDIGLTYTPFKQVGGSICNTASMNNLDTDNVCQAVGGSTLFYIEEGLNVDFVGTCSQPGFTSPALKFTFEAETSRLYNIKLDANGVGLAVYAGEKDDEVTCDGVVASVQVEIGDQQWTGFLEAGTYTVVAFFNGLSFQVDCDSWNDYLKTFVATISAVEYPISGVADQMIIESCSGFSEDTVPTAVVSFTPETDGAWSFLSNEINENGTVILYSDVKVISSENLPVNYSAGEFCGAEFVPQNQDFTSFNLTEGMNYTLYIQAVNPSANVFSSAYRTDIESRFVIFQSGQCNLIPDDQDNYLVPDFEVGYDTTNECSLTETEFNFELYRLKFDIERFMRVTAESTCYLPFNGTGLVLPGPSDFMITTLYRGLEGELSTDTEVAVPPTTCTNFIESARQRYGGDSGTGLSYILPANTDITVVVSAASTGVYYLGVSDGDLVGCVPEDTEETSAEMTSENNDDDEASDDDDAADDDDSQGILLIPGFVLAFLFL